MSHDQATDLDIDTLIERGLEAVSAGHWSIAWDAFDTARQLAPTRHEPYLNLGSLAQLQRDHGAAVEWYSQALRHCPDHLSARYCRGLSYAAQQQWYEALRDYDQVIALQADFYEAYLNRGYVRRAMGQLNAALRDLDYFLAYQVDPQEGGDLVRQARLWRQEVQQALAHQQPIDPEQRLTLAREALKLGDGQTALRHYSAVLEQHPWHREARLSRTHLYASLGERKKTLQEFDLLHQQYPRDGEVWYLRAVWLRRWEDHQAAEQALEYARRMAPELPEVYLELGRSKADSDPLAAIQWLGESLRRDPMAYEGYTLRGHLLRKQGQPLLAIEDYRHSLGLKAQQADVYEGVEAIIAHFDAQVAQNPDLPRTYVARANLYRQLGRPADALVDWGHALRLDPDNPILIAGRARTLADQQNWDQALNAYTCALELAPDQAGFYYERAEVLNQLMRADEAGRDLDRAIDLAPEKGNYYLLRGIVLRGRGEWGAAMADLNQALRLDQDLAQAWQERAVLHLTQHDLPSALNDYRRAAQLAPSPELHHDCATVAEALEQENLALHHLNQALALSPRAVEIRSDRAALLLQQRQWDAALQDLNHILDLEPQAVASWLMRAEAYFHLRQWTEAASDASRTLVRDATQPLAYYLRGMSYYELAAYEQAARDLKRFLQMEPHSSAREQVKQRIRKAENSIKPGKGKRWRWKV